MKNRKNRKNIGKKKIKKTKTKKQRGGKAEVPQCSPISNKKKSNPYQDSCFNVKQLKSIANKLNKNTNNIEKKIKVNQDKKNLVKDINIKFCSVYGNIDFCILDDKKWKGDSDILQAIRDSFAPPRPAGKYEWLNSIDIRDVMEQYEKKYPEFQFLGPVPIDFQKMDTEVGNLNLKNIKKYQKKIGIIFNTDPANQPGEHWISMFIDLDNNTLCFFDSTGDEPPKQIVDLIEKLIEQSKNLGITNYLKPIINKEKHQFQDSECGVYSIYFILQRLQGKSCNSIFTKKIDDESMNKNRKVLFSNRLPNVLQAFALPF